MNLSDLDKVIKIEINNYPVPWNKRLMQDCIKSGYHSILLKQKNEIIGYAFLMTAFDESHLLNMCIDKKQRQLQKHTGHYAFKQRRSI